MLNMITESEPKPMPVIREHSERISPGPLAPTIFHEAWWLDIVTGGDYAVAEVSDNGKTVGRLPYFLKRRGGLQYSIMPPMTHFIGPAVVHHGGPPATRFLWQAKVTHELIRQLPPASIYQWKCHRDITDAIAFQQEKFHTTVQFTHEVFPDTEEVLWQHLRGEKRKKIRSAQRSVILRDVRDPSEFWQAYDRNLQHKGNRNVCDRDLCCRLIEGCLARDRGRIYGAYDQHGQLTAAVFCIWDQTSAFYFMSTRNPGAHQGAISLLAWEAMKEAASRGLIFDFDGLNNGNAVLFFTEFGGIVSPRYIVTRRTTFGGLALDIKNRFRESRYFY